jgi:hypothetical protein
MWYAHPCCRLFEIFSLYFHQIWTHEHTTTWFKEMFCGQKYFSIIRNTWSGLRVSVGHAQTHGSSWFEERWIPLKRSHILLWLFRILPSTALTWLALSQWGRPGSMGWQKNPACSSLQGGRSARQHSVEPPPHAWGLSKCPQPAPGRTGTLLIGLPAHRSWIFIKQNCKQIDFVLFYCIFI